MDLEQLWDLLCTLLLIPPIIPLCTITERIFDWLGQDPDAAKLAGDWIPVYLLGAPAVLLFQVIQRFLVAQHKPWPPVYASVIPCFVIHPFLLSWLVPTMGLQGSALAIAMTQWLMAIFSLLYLRFVPVIEPATWPGLSWKYMRESMAKEPTLRFLHLSLGGVLSLTEWWIWEVMCFIAGSYGVEELCAHTIAYNLIPLLYIIPLGLCIGLSVRMGNLLSINVHRAGRLAAWTMLMTIILGILVASALYNFRGTIMRLFTDDPSVIELCEAIWFRVCIYVFILYIFGIHTAILRGTRSVAVGDRR